MSNILRWTVFTKGNKFYSQWHTRADAPNKQISRPPALHGSSNSSDDTHKRPCVCFDHRRFDNLSVLDGPNFSCVTWPQSPCSYGQQKCLWRNSFHCLLWTGTRWPAGSGRRCPPRCAGRRPPPPCPAGPPCGRSSRWTASKEWKTSETESRDLVRSETCNVLPLQKYCVSNIQV